jgi:purine-cytosine permease-like protein
MDSSKYQPPVRRSLSDAELDARVNLATSSNTGVEALMELLVAQETLRAQEDAEIQAWVSQMEAEGSPEALAALARFRGQDAPVVPTVSEIAPQPITEPVVEETKPFSWLSTPEEPEVSGVPVEEVIVTFEEVVTPIAEEIIPEEITSEPELIPVGSETQDDFEKLLSAAAAEEELTALEEGEELAEDLTGPKNILIPSEQHRNRKPLSQFFAWLGASATVVPILLTLLLISFGLSATAIVVDLVVGYLVAGVFVSIAGLAGKRSGLSTSVISRAIFGVWGSSISGTFMAVSRIALTALVISSALVVTNGVFSFAPDFNKSLVSIAGVNLSYGLAMASTVVIVIFALSFVSGKGSRVLQFVFSGLALGLLVASFFGVVGSKLSIKTSGSFGPLSKESLAGIAMVVLVVSVLWVSVAPNLSKSIPMKQRGVKVFLSLLTAQFLLPVLVGLFGLAWLGPETMRYVTIPVGLTMFQAIVSGSMLSWAGMLFFIGLCVALLYMALLSFKTATLDVMSLFRFKGKVAAKFISLVSILGLLVLFSQQPIDLTIEYLSNVSALVAVLSAAWIGMFISDVALRRIAYHELSLTRSYGFYGKFNILSFFIWVISTAAALLLVPINLVGMTWTGYFGTMFGITSEIGSQAVAFLAVVILAMLLTVISRIPQIRKQEREVLEVESRREQLNDIFIGQEA